MIYSYFNFVTVPIVMTDNLIRREECYPISSSANNCKRGDAIPSECWRYTLVICYMTKRQSQLDPSWLGSSVVEHLEYNQYAWVQSPVWPIS